MFNVMSSVEPSASQAGEDHSSPVADGTAVASEIPQDTADGEGTTMEKEDDAKVSRDDSPAALESPPSPVADQGSVNDDNQERADNVASTDSAHADTDTDVVHRDPRVSSSSPVDRDLDRQITFGSVQVGQLDGDDETDGVTFAPLRDNDDTATGNRSLTESRKLSRSAVSIMSFRKSCGCTTTSTVLVAPDF